MSLDGRLLAGTRWAEGRGTVWDVNTGDKGGAWRVHAGHEGRAGYLAFSPDGLTLATTGAQDRRVNLWDVSFLRALEPRRKSK